MNKNNKLVHIGPASMFFETKKPAMMKGKMAAGSARQAASSATSKNKIPAGTDAALEALKANNAKEKAAREANTWVIHREFWRMVTNRQAALFAQTVLPSRQRSRPRV